MRRKEGGESEVEERVRRKEGGESEVERESEKEGRRRE